MTIKHSKIEPGKNGRKPVRNAKKDRLTGTYTEIVCILDRSGSMSAIQDDTIGGFNEFLIRQKKVDGKARLTLVLFDDQYEVVHSGMDIKTVAPLTENTFVPRGNTAMLDAIGRTLRTMTEKAAARPAADRPGSMIVAILTDGEENASREFTLPHISDLIAEKRAQGWEFIFLAANQDAIASATRLSIPMADAQAFVASEAGTREAFSDLSARLMEKRRKMALGDDLEA